MMRAATGMLLVVGICGGGAAEASPYDDLVVGASLGRGQIQLSCDRCDDVDPLTEAVAVSGHVGFMANPELALVVDAWAVIWDGRDNRWFTDSDDHTVHELFATAAAQLWLTNRLWVKGGLGFAHYDFDEQHPTRDDSGVAFLAPPSERGTSWAPAATAALGFTLVDTPTFDVDIQLRTGAAEHSNAGFRATNTSLSFGANWY